MSHFQRIYEGLDVAPILAELDAAPHLWDAHRARKDAPGSPHSRMSDIWLRYNDAAPFEAGERPWSEFNDPHFPIWYPGWYALPSLHRIVYALMAATQGEALMGVLITRIPAGQGIAMHADRGWHVSFTDKYYLSLRNPPGAKFICHPEGEAAEVIEPEPGSITLFDNRKPHAVANDSDGDRITCIICIHKERAA